MNYRPLKSFLAIPTLFAACFLWARTSHAVLPACIRDITMVKNTAGRLEVFIHTCGNDRTQPYTGMQDFYWNYQTADHQWAGWTEMVTPEFHAYGLAATITDTGGIQLLTVGESGTYYRNTQLQLDYPTPPIGWTDWYPISQTEALQSVVRERNTDGRLEAFTGVYNATINNYSPVHAAESSPGGAWGNFDFINANSPVTVNGYAVGSFFFPQMATGVNQNGTLALLFGNYSGSFGGYFSYQATAGSATWTTMAPLPSLQDGFFPNQSIVMSADGSGRLIAFQVTRHGPMVGLRQHAANSTQWDVVSLGATSVGQISSNPPTYNSEFAPQVSPTSWDAWSCPVSVGLVAPYDMSQPVQPYFAPGKYRNIAGVSAWQPLNSGPYQLCGDPA